MDENKIITEGKENRKKNVEVLLLKVLSKMLEDDLKYLDTHYIQNRTLEIIERTISKVNFSNQTLLNARKAYLDVLLDGAKVQMFGFDDDYALAKENVKIKEGKAKALEVLRKVERLRGKIPKDSSEQREMECEPVCQMIATEVLSKDLIFKDEAFIDGCIESDNKSLVQTLSGFLCSELFDQLVTSLDNSYISANEKNWGCPRDKIKLSQIDNRIKGK